MKQYRIVILAAGLAACQPATAPQVAAPAASPVPSDPHAEQVSVKTFVQATCGDCHAVEPAWLSPNPEAPTFLDIANREGLTQESLTVFLRDAHNYPEAMDFDLTRKRADELAAYIIQFRSDDYTPPK